MILSAWPIIPIILSVRSCYTLYIYILHIQCVTKLNRTNLTASRAMAYLEFAYGVDLDHGQLARCIGEMHVT